MVVSGASVGFGAVVERQADLRTDDGDHERFAHYADKNQIMAAMVEGTVVEALCGKRWVPSRDPKKYPVCPDCKRIYDGLGDSSGKS